MHLPMTTRRAALALVGAAALVVLLTVALAGPARAAPRTGITAARGVPAEAVAAAPGGATFRTQPLSSASIAAPLTRSEDYGVMPWAAAWAIGALGALLLVGGAAAIGRAQRRGRSGRVAEVAGGGPPAGEAAPSDAERRKAA